MVCWESQPQHTKECVCMDGCARVCVCVCVCTLGAALGLQKQFEKGSLQAAPHWWRLMLLGSSCSITLLSNSAVLLVTFSLAASAAGICVEEHEVFMA